MDRNTASFACNTYSYTISHGAEACLLHLADLGFTDFELMIYPGHLWPPNDETASRAALRRFVQSRSLRIVSLNMPNVDINVAGAAEQMRRYSIDLLKGIVTLAGALGVPGVVIGPGKANPLFPAPRERLIGYFFTALDELVPLAEKAGTALWVENMPFAFLPDIDGLMDALDRYSNDDIGIVYDIANGHFINEDIANALRRCRKRLKLLHLSDTGQQHYRHDAIGLGTVPFWEFPPVLAEIGYCERPVLEIISHQADEDILSSADKLAAMGYGRA
jgi:L-ribulose-5-phosphate 3-epimerase